MNIKILKEEKNYLEIEIDNLTLAEVMRSYLWKNKSTILAGWKREHPTKPIVLVLKTKGDAKKVLKESIEKLRQELKELKQIAKKLK